MSNYTQFQDFKKEVEKLREIDGAEEYAKQLAYLFLGNGLSLQTILLMAIEFGQQHPAWVSVEERLPPRLNEKSRFSETVLVYNKAGFKDVTYYDFKEKAWKWAPEVTHWMQITPPVKKGGEQ